MEMMMSKDAANTGLGKTPLMKKQLSTRDKRCMEEVD
jgi:hypothetical protein